MSTVQQDVALSDDDVLDYTQGLRKRYVDHVTLHGTRMPDDPKDAKVFLTALSDMDKTAMKKKQLLSDEEQGKQSAQAIAELAAAVSRSIQRPLDDGTERPVPRLDESGMDPLQTVPGETMTGLDTATYAEFEAR